MSLDPRFAVSNIFIDPVRLGGALRCHLLQMLPLLPQGRSQVTTASCALGRMQLSPAVSSLPPLPLADLTPQNWGSFSQDYTSKSADKHQLFFQDLLFAFQVYICRYYVLFFKLFVSSVYLVGYKIYFVNKSSTSTEIFQCQKQSPS